MGSFMGKTKICYEFKRKNVNCYSCPAYRATLLLYRRVETKSPLTFLIYLKQFVTIPIASFPKFTGRKVGQKFLRRPKPFRGLCYSYNVNKTYDFLVYAMILVPMMLSLIWVNPILTVVLILGLVLFFIRLVQFLTTRKKQE